MHDIPATYIPLLQLLKPPLRYSYLSLANVEMETRSVREEVDTRSVRLDAMSGEKAKYLGSMAERIQ